MFLLLETGLLLLHDGRKPRVYLGEVSQVLCGFTLPETQVPRGHKAAKVR